MNYSHYSKMILFFLCLGTAVAPEVHAREIVYGKAKETLSVSFGVETLFRFPMEVKTITEAQRFEIRPASADEPDYSVIAVKPRMKQGVSDITFILSDGSVIRTQLIISNQPNLKKDSIYDFKPKDELMSSNPNLIDKREPLAISELDLMRSMMNGDRLSGFEIHPLDQNIEMGSSADISVRLIKSYIGSGMNGFVYRIRSNSKDQNLSINLETVAVGQPNLALLAQVDRPLGRGEGDEPQDVLLRVVTKAGASSRKIILPLAIQKEEKS
jgi:hypothetical protein